MLTTYQETWAPSRRQLLLSGAAGIVLATSAQAQAQPPKIGGAFAAGKNGRLTLGLSGLDYYIGFCPVLNWQKMAGSYNVTRKIGGKISGKAVFDEGYVDSTSGEIANPTPADAIAYTRLFYASPGVGNAAGGHNFSGEHWTIKWDGTGLCAIGGLTEGGSQSILNGMGRGTFRFGKNPGNTWATFTITNVNDPPRNIHIYQTRYADHVQSGETFNPDWLAQIRDFGILRFMDWMATNNSLIAEFSQIADERYFAWGKGLTSSSSYGPKGGMPLSVICQLVNLTQCNIHFCIPHLATDACVQSIAAYFRDHLDPGIVITFEFSNECWNFGLQQTAYCREQAQSIWPGEGPASWYGYRSAQCMKLIRDIFDDRSRWRGCLATQTVNTGVTKFILIGVDYFRTHTLSPANSLTIADLFNEISVTGYFGDVQGGKPLTKITNANPAVVTSRSHGYKNGQRLKLFIGTGMTELNNAFVTVANATKDTFELAGVDSMSNRPSVTDDRNYASSALVFELMDKSVAKYMSDPTNYATKYIYFNRVAAASWLNGSSEGFATSVSVASLKDTFWPGQKAIADTHGLDLRQYEGGLHYLGNVYLTGYGGNPQFTEFLVNIGHTKETADVYAAMYSTFFQVGGHYPSKFVEAGLTSRYGTWAGLRFIPGDESNPVWVATRAANGR